MSVIAMLNDPNISSPANVDAAVQVCPPCPLARALHGKYTPQLYRVYLLVLPAHAWLRAVCMQFRDDPKAFRRRVRDLVARSLEE